MENGVKGTVTPLASVFPVEGAQKAAKRVQETLANRQKELDYVHNFVVDNTNLVNLVQRLPDELSHDVMVPFGTVAFFPGRLIHTNEFLVLLGEGYYVERTSRQTIEILQRRGKVLQEQVDSLKATIEDLKIEASFFDTTAIEAAEGLVEIREDCVEESPLEERANQSGVSKSVGSFEDNTKDATEDEEYARMMARLDELEKVELAAESNDEDGDEDFCSSISPHAFDHHLSDEHQLMDSVQQTEDKRAINTTTEYPLQNIGLKQDFVKQSAQIEDLGVPLMPKEKPISVEKPLLSPGLRKKVDLSTASRTEVAEDKSTSYRSETGSNSSKAFTGSIVEHTHGLQTKSVGQTTTSQPSKPVSRFKMQKGGR
ncbi:RNA polymerase II subunit 5-mediating protein homolog isoform X3 [Macadamia integrifolia]|uniref:RNA polymerase II subunit 5-mediating protein homolog isoform X1 n=1 Tax=Macadamia integrifolia TaxID=60698 RepID=UPI001C5274E5|nr:RNA polymerase II subunit 5-mediating protein homolog isoform X1 [Macadamia integrifolia]XP_042519903.1 RNA polymerase II subunit 5-mediating protein homolog isoform X1 [Macadamia integrifolia]XP_042519904.1 RNA polymerase II subunit 5-mediating protein homolog isoform X3 [Macadamia integrifolia]